MAPAALGDPTCSTANVSIEPITIASNVQLAHIDRSCMKLATTLMQPASVEDAACRVHPADLCRGHHTPPVSLHQSHYEGSASQHQSHRTHLKGGTTVPRRFHNARATPC
jgi:hypothetical protein